MKNTIEFKRKHAKGYPYYSPCLDTPEVAIAEMRDADSAAIYAPSALFEIGEGVVVIVAAPNGRHFTRADLVRLAAGWWPDMALHVVEYDYCQKIYKFNICELIC